MTEVREGYRPEHNSISEKEAPIDAYHDVQALHAHKNFNITGPRMRSEFIISAVQIRKVATITNFEVGEFSKERVSTVVKACDEIIDGKPHDQFIIDPIQDGAGTSLNMNTSEVIVNRAIEIFDGARDDYSIVNPNDHANFGQFTNDVSPSHGKMATLTLLRRAQIQLERLEKALLERSDEFDAVIKMGRMQLQDTVPVRPGQEFHACASVVGRDIHHFDNVKKEVCSLNMGGATIGTDLNADTTCFHHIVRSMSTIINEELVQSYDTTDATQNSDGYAMVSGIVKSCAVNLSKMCNDLRLMSSGPHTNFCEISLPAKRSGSSIMSGKINPVIPKVMGQIVSNVVGNGVVITMAIEAGQLELNAFEPIIFYNPLESIQTLGNAIRTLVDSRTVGITADREYYREVVKSSIGITTVIRPYVGYKTATNIVKEVLRTDQSVRELILQKRLFSEGQLETTLDPYTMMRPGIQGRNPTDLLSD